MCACCVSSSARREASPSTWNNNPYTYREWGSAHERERREPSGVARRVTSRRVASRHISYSSLVKLYLRFQRYNYLRSPRVTSQPLLPRSQFSLSLDIFLKDKKKTDCLDIHPRQCFVVFEYSYRVLLSFYRPLPRASRSRAVSVKPAQFNVC